MSPAERASLINKQEFLAECQAIRRRAFDLLKQPPKREARVQAWIDRDGPTVPFNINTMTKAKTYTYDGMTMTLTQWEQRTGIPKTRLSSRIRKGWPMEDVFTKPVRNPSYTFDGKTMNLTEWEAHTGIAKTVLSSRICIGWSMEDVFTKPVRPSAKGSKPEEA